MADDDNDYTLPDFQDWNIKQFYDHQAQINDYGDLQELAMAINAARTALFSVTQQINVYERKAVAAKTAYDRAYRRAYIVAMDKTEAQKKIRAELACEELENAYLFADQLKSELNRTANTLRLELQTLQGIGNNLRQQMKME